MKKLWFFFVPIHRDEYKKFLCMGTMLFFILFNYSILRALKDGLIVPNIGAEAISFVKIYTVTPAALLFAILYAYLSHHLDFKKIFYYISAFFLIFFLLFGFVLYPNRMHIHPSEEYINYLLSSDISILGIGIEHFKWFLKIYGKWLYVVFYIVAELWGSAMIFMLYWQFANRITHTDEAKRLYPMCSFIGHIGTVVAGMFVEYFAMKPIQKYFFMGIEYENQLIVFTMFFAVIALVGTMFTFLYINNSLLTHRIYIQSKKPSEIKTKLSIKESFKIVFSSRYLGLLVILIFSYGICINLTEGVWKSKAQEIYTTTNEFTLFSGNVVKWTGICSMAFLICSAHILRIFGWLVGAMFTPLVLLVTGSLFFLFVVFGQHLEGFVDLYGVNLVYTAVILGTIQNVLSKGTKYSLFDATKEMAYIPTNEHIRSKGKAAVDVVGARWAKSGGAVIQSLLFTIFPLATYSSIAPYLMTVFILVVLVWIYGVKKLNAAYEYRIHNPH